MSAERDALIAALVAEYVALLAHTGDWAPGGTYEGTRIVYTRGARVALKHVAARLGVDNLHERAAEVVARGDGADDQRHGDDEDESNEDWRARAEQVGWR